MLDNKTQLITYVGKKPIKRDTVAGTGIIWCGYGDTQEVMHGAAVKLLQHPDVWTTKAKFDLLNEKLSEPKLSDEEKAAIEKANAKKLADAEAARLAAEAESKKHTEAELAEKAKALREALQAQGNPDEKPAPAGLSSVDKPEDNDSADASPDRSKIVKSALLSMDQTNEEHFSPQTGNPLINAVREIAGDKTISLKEVNAAWSELKSAAK